MAGSPAYGRIKSDILDLVDQVPSGTVTTYAAIGARLSVMPRVVSTILAALTERERETVAWHRVVADGGAIGRHAWRVTQIERLRGEGVSVSAAGIVAEFGGGGPSKPKAPSSEPVPGAGSPRADTLPSRARGRIDRPRTRLT